jgi:Domain of unknown function (DUF4410)
MLRKSVGAPRLVRALCVFGVALSLCYGEAASADAASGSERLVLVEAPVDHSGKTIEAEVLTSLHDELASALGKSDKVAGKLDAQVLVQIEVTDFHMRNQASRWMLGGMSGKDYITSKVTVVDTARNATLFTTEVKTSTANQYRGQDSIARMHADEIAKALATAMPTAGTL